MKKLLVVSLGIVSVHLVAQTNGEREIKIEQGLTELTEGLERTPMEIMNRPAILAEVANLERGILRSPSVTTHRQELAIRCKYTVHPYVLTTLWNIIKELNTITDQHQYPERVGNRTTDRREMEVFQDAKKTLERIKGQLDQESTLKKDFLATPLSRDRFQEILKMTDALLPLMDPNPNTRKINLPRIKELVVKYQPILQKYDDEIKTARFENQRGTTSITRGIGEQIIDMRPRCNALLGRDYLAWIIGPLSRFEVVPVPRHTDEPATQGTAAAESQATKSAQQ